MSRSYLTPTSLRGSIPNAYESNSTPNTPVTIENMVHNLGEALRTPDRYTRLPEPATVNAEEHFPQGRTKTAGGVFDISPEIGHTFVAPMHEMLFDRFKNRMSRYLPFVVLTAEHTPAVMFRDKPFLYTCCVMTAAHRDPPLQSRIARDILRYVSEHMLLLGEKSLDLLQGLVVLVAWYHVYSHNQPQLMNLLHLAKALLVDLGLNRPPGHGIFSIKVSGDARHLIHGNDPDSTKHKLEEQRACLALYHLHTQYAFAFGRLDPNSWTEHLNNCCLAVESAAQCASDGRAAALIRLDHLLERYIGAEGLSPGVSMPIPTYIKLFSNDIDSYVKNLSPSLQADNDMRIQILITRLSLLEPAILADAGRTPAHKVEALHLCNQTIIDFFDAFAAQRDEDIPHIPFLSWVTISHAFDTLARISTLQTEGWDLDYVRNNPGFASLCDRMTQRLDTVHAYEEKNYPASRSIRFKMFGARVQKFIQWYEAKIRPASREEPQNTTRANLGDVYAWHQPTPLVGEFSDLLWQDFLADVPQFDPDISLTGL